MEPLLRTIAREYSQRYKNLKDICFLFPNKRCGIFLKKYLAEYDIHTEDLPHILTISEFASQVAGRTEASRIVQLFTLYKCYLDILGKDSKEEPETVFEDFRRWGEIVISDFNTVDINLADSNEIFKNVKDFREISSNFLTEDQKDVMREYFGVEPMEDDGSFWKNFNNPKKITALKHKFLNLWQILSPLHKKFIEKLESDGYGTAGSIYRSAAAKIIAKGRDALPYKKMVVIGFNALTESERRIFKKLRDSEAYADYDSFIDFLWDASGPLLHNEFITASRFVDSNKKHFPSPEWWHQIETRINEESHFPEIKIISSPSNTAQTKVAGELLDNLISKEGKKKIDNSEVALVLPDESLLSNLLYSLPDSIERINLTMGLSLLHSSISGFMSLLRRCYVSLHEKDDERIFYVKDLKLFLSHPLAYVLFDYDEIQSLFDDIDENRLVTIEKLKVEKFLSTAGELLNFPSKKIKDYKIFDFLNKILESMILNLTSSENPEARNNEISHIRIYKEYVESLKEAMIKFEIKSLPLSIFSLVNRVVAKEKIGFEGEPLFGLQVMGTLETRSLDFKDVIVLSMNEGIMPRKAYISTFIPESLRKAYALPPARYSEEIFGYYFYRLISRADKVYLIYDGRTISGMRGGESRYLLQLKHYYPKQYLSQESWQYNIYNRKKDKFNVEKTPEIREIIEEFSSTEDDKKNFSASALNNYRECEKKFFLRNVLNINSDPERGEFMDPISIGNVLHDVMLNIYLEKKEQGKLLNPPKEIQKNDIEEILQSPEKIKNLVAKSIQTQYYGDRSGDKERVKSGVTDIIAEQIEDLVKTILTFDKSLAPFKLHGSEIKKKIRVKLKSGREVNFNFAIDRLDEIQEGGLNRLRIVDYKTGSLKLKAKDLAEVFEGGYRNEQIFQLFVYAWLLGKIGVNGWEDVMTEIYYLPALSKGERSLPEFEKTEVLSFRPYKDEFGERLDEMIESIFTEPEFTNPSTTQVCEYCGFKNLCLK